MLFYKNNTPWTTTVNGITFKPGEVKETDRYINVYGFIRVSECEKPTDSEDKSTAIVTEPEETEVSIDVGTKKKRYKKPANTKNIENNEIKEEMSNG